ncbi:MAG: hypothetical protein PHQ86_09615 [Dehalococcoidales bacterium]|nr:hypothetical protein [Dehalococcoidales bacterium]
MIGTTNEHESALKIDIDRLDIIIENSLTNDRQYREYIDEIKAIIGTEYLKIDGTLNSLIVRSAELLYSQGIKDGIYAAAKINMHELL